VWRGGVRGEARGGGACRRAGEAGRQSGRGARHMDTVRRYQDAGSSQPAKAGAADVIDPSSISLTPYFAHHQLAIWLLC
jgi:hypothetical protein